MDLHNLHRTEMVNLQGQYAQSKASERHPAAPTTPKEGKNVRDVHGGEVVHAQAVNSRAL
jgi:hypothetical protein